MAPDGTAFLMQRGPTEMSPLSHIIIYIECLKEGKDSG